MSIPNYHFDEARHREVDYAYPDGPTKLFDITQVIGTVFTGDKGDADPHTCAMIVIAEHTKGGNGGVFYFPSENGMTTVTVDFTDAV